MKYENLYWDVVTELDAFGGAYEHFMKFRSEFDKKLKDIESKQEHYKEGMDPDYDTLVEKWFQIERIIENPLTKVNDKDFL